MIRQLAILQAGEDYDYTRDVQRVGLAALANEIGRACSYGHQHSPALSVALAGRWESYCWIPHTIAYKHQMKW